MTAYTTTLQTELQQVGYYDGPIDGIYGPATVDAVKRLQADSDLPETGFVDRATAEALDQLLAELGLQAAAADMTHTAAVQTVLSLTGFWNGPIDGVWTDELTAALQEFQARSASNPRAPSTRRRWPPSSKLLPSCKPRRPTTNAPATTVPWTTPTTPVTADDPAAGEATVLVADSDLGQILTAADGMTVYLFMTDAQGAPTCTDSCAQAWPPLTVDDASQLIGGDGVDGSLLGTTEHPAAGIQVTYNGWPLYLFAGDSAPGDTNGQGQGGVWYVVDPAGNAIDSD